MGAAPLQSKMHRRSLQKKSSQNVSDLREQDSNVQPSAAWNLNQSSHAQVSAPRIGVGGALVAEELVFARLGCAGGSFAATPASATRQHLGHESGEDQRADKVLHIKILRSAVILKQRSDEKCATVFFPSVRGRNPRNLTQTVQLYGKVDKAYSERSPSWRTSSRRTDARRRQRASTRAPRQHPSPAKPEIHARGPPPATPP